MPTTREIRRRINSVKNINQVTRALEAVAASRVRKAQDAVIASRPYAQYAYDVLVNVAAQSQGTDIHPLLKGRDKINAVGILLITGDRGLAGAYNARIIQRAKQVAWQRVEDHQCPVRWVTVGRRGSTAIRRWIANLHEDEDPPEIFKQQEIVYAFPAAFTDPDLGDVVARIAQVVTDEFISGQVDEVFVAYTHFINTMTQKPRVLPLLPLRPFEAQDRRIMDLVEPDPEVKNRGLAYIYEPDAASVLGEVIPRFTTLQILHAVRESLSSEHSARMVAMRNASDSAEALGEALQLEYNKARQLAITSELLDIIGGVEAMKLD
ncbi:MAG: ATP synthase F1 subunit gamma [Anaerolineae bacterium]|nr:ATP synthase F1 subunit gamma [Anaerolineae bacterium]